MQTEFFLIISLSRVFRHPLVSPEGPGNGNAGSKYECELNVVVHA